MTETTARLPRPADSVPDLGSGPQAQGSAGPSGSHTQTAQRPAEQGRAEQPWQTEASTPWNAVVRRVRSLGADTAYVLVTLPWSLVAFVVVFAGLAVAVPLMVLGVGFPIAVGVLVVGRWFATVERNRTQRRAVLAGDLPLATPSREAALDHAAPLDGVRPSLPRRVLASLRDPQGWRETLHALTAWILSIVTFTVTVTWWVGAVAGTTAYAWVRFLPENTGNDDVGGAARDALEVLNSTGFKLAAGIVFLLTLLPMTRAMARLQTGFARTLLDAPGAGARR